MNRRRLRPQRSVATMPAGQGTLGHCMRSRWLGFCALLACCCAPLRAGVPEIPRFRVLTVADGLPATEVTVLARDHTGYLWMATWDGLARYDGVNFKVWRHDPADPASLPGNVVQTLHVDAQDRVWVGTENGGLSMLGPEREGFVHYRKTSHPQIGSDDIFIVTSCGGRLWFGAFGGGLHRMEANGSIVRYAHDPAAPDGLPTDDVYTLACEGGKQLWIGTTAGLARFDGQRVRRVPLPGDAAPIVFGIAPIAGRLWVGTADGVFRREADGNWNAPAWSGMFARPNAAVVFAESGDGEMWLGGQGGLWRTNGERAPTPVSFDAQRKGVGRVVPAMLRQPDGGLWVPLPTRGLGYLRADWRRIAALTSAQGLSGGVYRALAPARDGGVWLGNSLGAVEHLDKASGMVAPLEWEIDALKGQRVTSLLQDRSGYLWVGSADLVRIDPATGDSQRWSSDDTVDATPGTRIDWLRQAPSGDIWLSTQGGGLQRRDGVTGKVLERVNDESGHGLTLLDTEAVHLAPDGALWLAGGQGLLQWDDTAHRFAPMIGGERVYSFVFQDNDRVWLHRLSGIEAWRRTPAGWKLERRVGMADGIPAVESTGLEIDAGKRLWLATRRGMLRVDTGGDKVAVRIYGVRDGLPNQEFNDHGTLMGGDGVLIGTTIDGSMMLLDTLLPDPPPVRPNLVLDGIGVDRDGKRLALPVQGGFELRDGDHELAIVMRLLSFDDPFSNRYRSRLEGFDAGWVDQGASGERVFSSLPPGRYTLRLQGFDAAGNASEERVLQFAVLPPWWRSHGGIAGFALLGMLLLWWAAASYRQRVRRRAVWQLAEHKRELAEQASLAKTRFLATLGHEVRTPMTGVLGMSELLLGTPLDEKQRGYANAIQTAGKHLLRLVNDALDLARIEADKLELDEQDFDLRELVAGVSGLVAPMARKRGLRFDETIDADAPRALRGDPLRVRQILLNLLGNAVKFTEQGSVGLRVSAGENGGVRFTVSDTGPGLNAEQRERLFQRFEQAEGARTAARYGGSGLGLAICQELAHAMGGRIGVDSAPGQGARFIVELPLAEAVAAPPRSHEAQLAPAVRALRVLLVEDDPTVAEVVAGLLQKQGHTVEHAPHGLAALMEVASAEFDIALLDLDLPGLDGLALARQLRAQGFSVPLLAVTARADAQAEPAAKEAGFDGFLRKPLTGAMLAEAIEALIGTP